MNLDKHVDRGNQTMATEAAEKTDDAVEGAGEGGDEGGNNR